MSTLGPPAPPSDGAPPRVRRGQRAQELLIRRAEVSRLLRRGFTPGEIARQLGVPPTTVASDTRQIRAIAERAQAEAYVRLRSDQVDRLLDHHEWLRARFNESRERRVRRQLQHFVPSGPNNEATIKGSTIETTVDERGDARILEAMTKTVTAINALIRPPAEKDEGSGAPSWVPPAGATILTIPAVALPVPEPLQRALDRMPAEQPVAPQLANVRPEPEEEV